MTRVLREPVYSRIVFSHTINRGTVRMGCLGWVDSARLILIFGRVGDGRGWSGHMRMVTDAIIVSSSHPLMPKTPWLSSSPFVVSVLTIIPPSSSISLALQRAPSTFFFPTIHYLDCLRAPQ